MRLYGVRTEGRYCEYLYVVSAKSRISATKLVKAEMSDNEDTIKQIKVLGPTKTKQKVVMRGGMCE